jgi:serpin B
MASSLKRSVGCCARGMLALAAFSGCGASDSRQEASASSDVPLPQDSLPPGPEVTGDRNPALDAGADLAQASDLAVALEVGGPVSSVQRVIDPQVPEADLSTLAHDNAAFAFAVYKQLTTNNANLVFSPASISIALAMTYAGAAGATAAEMASALHFTLPPERLHPAFNAMDQALASRGQGALGADGGPMRLKIANAVWAQQNFRIKSEFLDTLAANYGAGVNLLDFGGAPEASRLTINSWVAQQTNDKILNLLPPGSIDGLTRLVLTDAVYLNAAWKTQFSAYSTADNIFNRLDGGSVSVKFMNQRNSLPAVQTSNYVAASLPYADPRLSLLLVVPAAGQFSQVESSLDADALAALVTGLTTQPVYLSLPRFRVETQASLKKLLGTLGMPSAFEGATADFTGMSVAEPLHISDVVHKAFINVAEKGTEAAAATAVIISGDASVGPPPPPELLILANRPFLYFLRDQPTGAIVFMGRVMDPAAP